MKNSNININLNQKNPESKYSSISKLLKNVTNIVANTSWMVIIKLLSIMFFVSTLFITVKYAYNIADDKEASREIALKLAQTKKEENIRDYVVTPKIQHDIEVLLYTLNADRVFIFELHNGKKNVSGLPFKYADMSYEVANIERKVDRCYRKYQDVPLTMYKYPDYMHKKKIMIGSVDDIEKIDFEFAKCIKEDGGEYLAMIYISNSGEPLGFLGISFHNTEYAPSDEEIESKLKSYGKAIGELIDLKVQLNEE